MDSTSDIQAVRDENSKLKQELFEIETKYRAEKAAREMLERQLEEIRESLKKLADFIKSN